MKIRPNKVRRGHRFRRVVAHVLLPFILAVSVPGCKQTLDPITIERDVPNDLYGEYLELWGKIDACMASVDALVAEVYAYVPGADAAAKKAEFSARHGEYSAAVDGLTAGYDGKVVTPAVIFAIESIKASLAGISPVINGLALVNGRMGILIALDVIKDNTRGG